MPRVFATVLTAVALCVLCLLAGPAAPPAEAAEAATRTSVPLVGVTGGADVTSGAVAGAVHRARGADPRTASAALRSVPGLRTRRERSGLLIALAAVLLAGVGFAALRTILALRSAARPHGRRR